MNIFLYLSENYPYNGRVEQVLSDFSKAKFFFAQDDERVFSLINEFNLRAEFITSETDEYLLLLRYILIFYNEEDEKAVRYARFAARKSKNLIIIPNEGKIYL